MKITFSHQSRKIEADMAQGRDISRPIRFCDHSESAAASIPAAIPPAQRRPLTFEGFVGDVRQGGACNVDRLDLIPHCHGTHTETVAHILKIPRAASAGEDDTGGAAETVPMISDVPPASLLTAALITVDPIKASESNDSYRPDFRDTDRIVTATAIETSLQKIDVGAVDALILRTDKVLYDFESGPETPFLSLEAMKKIVDLGVDHLLIDLPSVDRLDDGGQLSAHHVFWNVPLLESSSTKACLRHKTITEMITVDSVLGDGLYLLNLQVAPLVADATPSRPVIFSTVPV